MFYYDAGPIKVCLNQQCQIHMWGSFPPHFFFSIECTAQDIVECLFQQKAHGPPWLNLHNDPATNTITHQLWQTYQSFICHSRKSWKGKVFKETFLEQHMGLKKEVVQAEATTIWTKKRQLPWPSTPVVTIHPQQRAQEDRFWGRGVKSHKFGSLQ